MASMRLRRPDTIGQRRGSSAAAAAAVPRPPLRYRTAARAGGSGVDKGFSLLEWTSSLVPQGALVTGAKQGWRLAWETMVKELAPQDAKGGYVRPAYSFGGTIGSAEFPAVAGRYHLYVGNACGWCHRTMITLAVRGLAGAITHTALLDIPERATRGGWVMPPAGDPVLGARDLYGVYNTAAPGFRGRCTAPLLVDRTSRRIVCNESAVIVRELGALDLPGSTPVDLYPESLRGEIDALIGWIYPSINNGVYRCGFATSQAAYDEAAKELRGAMERADALLAERRFLAGDRFTEADVMLFPTMARFDAVYAGIFRCGAKRVVDYPHLHAWLRDVWQIKVPGSLQISDTVDIDEARRSYYTNLFPLNPSGIIPSGPTAADLRLDAPHNRGGGALEEVFFLRPAKGGAAAV